MLTILLVYRKKTEENKTKTIKTQQISYLNKVVKDPASYYLLVWCYIFNQGRGPGGSMS